MPDIYEDDAGSHNDDRDASARRAPTRGERLARSGLVTATGLALLLGIVAVVWTAHVRGRIHKITTTQVPESNAPAVRPGGQDVIRLERLERMGALAPEFTSVTLLPGDGMLMLQASLDLPGRGETPLLAGSKESDLQVGRPALGAAFSALMERREGSHWLPAVELLAGQASAQQNSDVVPDGSRATAHYTPSAQTGMDITVQTTLTGRALDLSLTGKNTGNVPRALTLSWRPRFAATQGLEALVLQPPAQEGSKPATIPEHVVLAARDLNETVGPLKRSYLSNGPQVRLRYTADGYTLVMTAMSASIRSLHVTTSRSEPSVLLAFSTSSADSAEGGRTIVQPGETLQWRVRLEAVVNSNDSAPTP